MLPDQIYQAESAAVPDIQVEVLRHVDLGERVICAHCKVNGLKAKRITQDIYGIPVNKIPVWNLGGRIVADWFALLLEAKYQTATEGKTIIIHPDYV